jgi:hypothetical protein
MPRSHWSVEAPGLTRPLGRFSHGGSGRSIQGFTAYGQSRIAVVGAQHHWTAGCRKSSYRDGCSYRQFEVIGAI